jgi:putative MATE family efflux protein
LDSNYFYEGNIKEKKMEHSKQLGEEKVSKLLIKFSIPAITGMVVNALYNVVDRIFVGQGVGKNAIAGITIGFPLMIVMMAFGMLIGIGATSLVSIRLGEQKKTEAEQIIGNALSLLIGISVLLTVWGLVFIDPLLVAFGASKQVLPYAKDYFKIILFGGIFQGIGFGLNNCIRAEGNPKIAMFTMLIGAITNTILDPLFIYVFKMGIAGAAWATVISMTVSAVWVLYYYLSGQSSLKLYWANLRLRSEVVWKIFAIGSAPFAMQLAASGITLALNRSLVTYGGDLAISAMGIVNSILMLIVMPVFGINQGAQPIIGYNYGARQFDRVKKALKIAGVAATIITTFGFIMVELFPHAIIQLFNREKDLVDLGADALRKFLILLPIVGFQIVGANYFQAVGKPKQAMTLSLSRQVLFLLPALFFLPRFYGLQGIFWAGPLSDLLSSVVTGIWLFYELKHLDRRHQEVSQIEPGPEMGV